MYLNVFRTTKSDDIDEDAYAVDGRRMLTLARQQKGFISFRSYISKNGEMLSLSEWETEADARAWQRNAEHIVVQAKGRSDYYQSYTSYSCENPKVRSFERSEN